VLPYARQPCIYPDTFIPAVDNPFRSATLRVPEHNTPAIINLFCFAISRLLNIHTIVNNNHFRSASLCEPDISAAANASPTHAATLRIPDTRTPAADRPVSDTTALRPPVPAPRLRTLVGRVSLRETAKIAQNRENQARSRAIL
jgi:hypothetical protein